MTKLSDLSPEQRAYWEDLLQFKRGRYESICAWLKLAGKTQDYSSYDKDSKHPTVPFLSKVSLGCGGIGFDILDEILEVTSGHK